MITPPGQPGLQRVGDVGIFGSCGINNCNRLEGICQDQNAPDVIPYAAGLTLRNGAATTARASAGIRRA